MAGFRVVQADRLEAFVAAVASSMGAADEVSTEVARHLVRSNLSGHDSHGVLRMAQYVQQADNGGLVPSASPVFISMTPVTALIDAGRGFGHYSTAFALDWAMRQAEAHGVATAAIRHSSHIGRLGEYTERAGERGLVCILTVGASGPGVGGMVLYGGTQRFFGANPWSISVPSEEAPIVFDGSTSAIAEGKVRFARAKGTPLPAGCIQDKDGNPTTDPEDFYAGGALLPLGGSVAGHKGFGLAMASSLVSGLAMIGDPDHSLIGASSVLETSDKGGQIAGVFLVVVNPAAFGDLGQFKSLVSENARAARRIPPARGVDQITLPGEPEIRTRSQRTAAGISLPDATWQELEVIGQRFGIDRPESAVA